MTIEIPAEEQTKDHLLKVVSGYKHVPMAKEDEERKTKAEQALELAKANCQELFLDQYGTPFAAVRIKEHIEVLPLNNSRFRNWLCKLCYESDGRF